MSNEKLREAFELGWKMAAQWSLSDHLLADMESPAYLTERDGLLQAIATTEQAAVLTEVADLGVVPKIIKPFTPTQRKRLWDNSKEHHKDAASFAGFERIVTLTERAHQIGTVFATTEPEPTGMPEVKPWDHPEPQTMRWSDLEIRWIHSYGEQCWKAGYKHGAWGDKPAVNQQLTTEPFDEREAFEREMSCEEIWGHRSFKKTPDGRYANWCVDLMWGVWQARAAMAKGVK